MRSKTGRLNNTLRNVQQRRHNTVASSATAALRNNVQSSSSSTILTWNEFFRLRTTRRYYSLASSLVGLVTSAAGTVYLLIFHPDQSENIIKLIPMDPIISTGIAVSFSMLAGWLLAPVLGNGVWRMVYRKRVPEFTTKERAFYERIKRHRVNPSGASTNNPVPDFYGEKVGSVSGYRRWLKDQRAFNRKRGGNYGSGI
jgi:mitochondrial import inner membrane translocase subunit TIM23